MRISLSRNRRAGRLWPSLSASSAGTAPSCSQPSLISRRFSFPLLPPGTRLAFKFDQNDVAGLAAERAFDYNLLENSFCSRRLYVYR